jgi:hypothetical protein
MKIIEKSTCAFKRLPYNPDMTTRLYFCDTFTSPIKLIDVRPMDSRKVSEMFPGVKALKSDGYSSLVGCDDLGCLLPVTRKVNFKLRPSLHACSAKCRGGKCGGTCECQCGGKFHGVGCA